MSLTSVKMSEEVWLTCVTHAVSTETEEIMGLLLGDIQYSKGGTGTALIWGASPQTRSDRQKDRVETNPEQLAAASAQAERMTIATGRTTRVIGWYHSHPHITVLPSHVVKRITDLKVLDDLAPCILVHYKKMEGARSSRTFKSVIIKNLKVLMQVVIVNIMKALFHFESRRLGHLLCHIRRTLFEASGKKFPWLAHLIDVRTQAMYQLLETGFIGLIFSCFNEDAYMAGRIQVIAFQSLDGRLNHTARPISLSPAERSTVVDVESLTSSEHTLTGLREIKEGHETGDARSSETKVNGKSSDLSGLFAHADANNQSTGVGENWDPKNRSDAFHDIEPMDMSDAMQEALHRSNLDMSGAEYVRKEIPIQVVPASSLLELDSPLSSFTDLQRVLYQEEQAAYQQAISQNMRDGKVHPLTFIHHTSTYQASLCKLMEYCLSPAVDALQERLRENEIRSALLNEESKKLEAETSKAVQPVARSPHCSDGIRGSSSHASSLSESSHSRSPSSKR